MNHRDVHPPVPRRDTDLLRQLIDAKHRTALVTASNDQLLANSLDNRFLSPALQVTQFAATHPFVNLLVTAHRTNQDERLSVSDGRSDTCHPLYVQTKVCHGTLHTTVFTTVDTYGSTLQRQHIGSRLEGDKGFRCTYQRRQQ